MPSAQHPQAKFDPIPPDLDLHGLVDRTPNFKWVQRVSRAQIRNLEQQEFEKLIAIHVIAGGKPLVIDGWDSFLPRWLFNAGWLEKTYDKKRENLCYFLSFKHGLTMALSRGECAGYTKCHRYSYDNWPLLTVHETTHKPVDSKHIS